jgi:hypothetical protein
MKNFKAGMLITLSVTLTSPPSFGWGGRGHHLICEAASHLTQEKVLHDYLKSKSHIMGYLCNIPDTHWRDISSEISKLGGPTHYVDMEILGVQLKEFPTDILFIVANYEGKENPLEKGKTIRSIATEMGTNWWRADQFYRRAISSVPAWKAAKPPANSQEEQNNELEFNKLAWDFMINLGVMGHFVGDNGQPYHLTIDYDGYGSGHGGIHAYYEESIVAALDHELFSKVMKEGQRLQKNSKNTSFLKSESVVENMKELGLISIAEIKEIEKLDKVIQPSVLKEEKGMKIKTAAVRQPAEKVASKFEKLIVSQLARSATLLAKIWDQAYVQVGRPPLAAHKSYRFPHKPDFVAPDYLVSPEKTK